MHYDLHEIGTGRYTYYFFKRNFSKVFAINVNGDTCQASIERDYSEQCGVELRMMQSRFNELPKYITAKLRSHILK